MENSIPSPSDTTEANTTVELEESTTDPSESDLATEAANVEPTEEPEEPESAKEPGTEQIETSSFKVKREPEDVVNHPDHPYLEDIMKCPCNEWQLEKAEPTPYKTLEEVPYTIVDTQELLDQMMEKLRLEKEIGLSSKHYPYDSFNGYNVLVLIATHSEVFFVDTLKLKEEMKVLNELLTSTAVLKVLHRSENTVEDLQKDLGLYLVNTFFLCTAWRHLHPHVRKKDTVKKHMSLTSMLKIHCEVEFGTLQQLFQDEKRHKQWNVRPLQEDKIEFGRLEVQYLLHIHQKYRNMMIEQDLLTQFYEKCRAQTQVYWYPGRYKLRPWSHITLYNRVTYGKKRRKLVELTKLQMEVFRKLNEWRNNTAREHDHRLCDLLLDDHVYKIASALPKDSEGIRNCMSPTKPSQLLEDNLDVVSQIIVKTMDGSSGKPDAGEIVPFAEEPEKPDLGEKRKNPDGKCVMCNKAEHNNGDSCSQKKAKKRVKNEARLMRKMAREQQNGVKTDNESPFTGKNAWRPEQSRYTPPNSLPALMGSLIGARVIVPMGMGSGGVGNGGGGFRGGGSIGGAMRPGMGSRGVGPMGMGSRGMGPRGSHAHQSGRPSGWN